MGDERSERETGKQSQKKLWFAGALLGIPGLVGVTIYWMVGGLPGPVEMPIDIIEGDWGEPEPPAPLGSLKVVSWNIHYGVGPKDDFDERQAKEQILKNLDGMAEQILKLKADIVFLQEVDFDSARTYGIDQMRYLAEKTGLRYMAPTVTWDKGYIPFPYWPPSKHYGGMKSGQAILSRFKLMGGQRLLLPKPKKNPWWYNLFYLDRCITYAMAKIGRAPIPLFNVHLEAFDPQNRMEQAELLMTFFNKLKARVNIMAGDFNSVPRNAKLQHAFPDEPDQDMRNDVTLKLVGLTGLNEMIDSKDYETDERRYFTFPSLEPNRRLDYLWYSRELKLKDNRVVHEAGPLSDHLPLFVEFDWKLH